MHAKNFFPNFWKTPYDEMKKIAQVLQKHTFLKLQLHHYLVWAVAANCNRSNHCE